MCIVFEDEFTINEPFLANRHTYVGRGKSSAEATKRAVRKVLEGLSSRPGYGPIHRFDRGPSTTGSHLRLAAFCQLMEWDVPLYKYTLKVASSKVWRTTKYTYVVIGKFAPPCSLLTYELM